MVFDVVVELLGDAVVDGGELDEDFAQLDHVILR